MITIANLSVSKRDIPPNVVRTIQRLCPEFESDGGFTVVLPLEDKRIREILGALEAAGLKAWNSERPRVADREFTIHLNRQYDEADLGACSHLEIYPTGNGRIYGRHRRVNDEALVLYRSSRLDITAVERAYCYVIADHARVWLESAGIRNLVLRPAVKEFMPEDLARSSYDDDTVWWELRSDKVLPPLAPSMDLRHTDHTPFTGDFSRGCWRKDGHHTHAELRYRAEDLAAAGPFDLAHTHEMFEARPNEYDRPLVASKRFYDACREFGVKTGWAPVRIDP